MDLGEFEKRYKKILSEMSADMNKALGIEYKLEVSDEELIKIFIGLVVLEQFKKDQAKDVRIKPQVVPNTYEAMRDLINGLKEKGNE